MVLIQTWAPLSMYWLVSRCTLYSSVNLPVVVVGDEGHKFLFGLFTEVFGIHQKQDAAGADRLFQQPIAGGDGSEGFAGAGGHLDQGAGLVLLERGFQVGDGVDLAVAQPFGIQLG